MRRFSFARQQALDQAAKDALLVVPGAPDSASRAVEIGVLSDLGALFAEQQATLLGGTSEEDAIDDLMISLFDDAVQDDALFAPRRDA